MAKKFYLVTMTERRYPDGTENILCQIKGNTSGLQSICYNEEIDNVDCVEKTLEEAQTIINEWQEIENESAEFNLDETPNIQPTFFLDKVVENG